MSPSSSGGPALARHSLADRVYERLVDAILSGTLASGAPLHVADIAHDLEVSPSPVRDAISRLVAEGLAASNPNRRTTVIRLERRDVVDAFELRTILECGAARLAAERIDADGLRALRSLSARCAALAGKPERKREMLDLDNEFHLRVAEASGNAALGQEVVRCTRRVRVMQLLKLAPARMALARAEHQSVIAALERRNPDGAEAAMREHLAHALDFVLEALPS
jgi:DNA-binding GntR family transcriptional regulator